MVRGVLIALAVCAFSATASAAHKPAHVATLSQPVLVQNVAPVGLETKPPFGWPDFCQSYSGECDNRDLPPTIIVLTAQTWHQLRSINDMVNSTIQPLSDMDHWRVVDKWDYPTDGFGDCEDYALAKRKLLMERGYPRQALLMTVVRYPTDGEGHAVLMAKTELGDVILDNRRDAILYWSDTGYEFIERQSQENQNRWVKLGNSPSPPLAVSVQ
jgi:predicted transglutaminase-like cysteine proteinase